MCFSDGSTSNRGRLRFRFGALSVKLKGALPLAALPLTPGY
ncbi:MULTISPECIES: hypothetical protein [unclassified Aliiroseovarius]|nr:MULTISPECIES: hypothetical protein [unclassified Aliiroseovarius]